MFGKKKKTLSVNRATDTVLKFLIKKKRGIIIEILNRKKIFCDREMIDGIIKLLQGKGFVTIEPGFNSVGHEDEVDYRDKDFVQKQEYLVHDFVKITKKGKHFVESGQKLAYEEILPKKEKMKAHWYRFLFAIGGAFIMWLINRLFTI